jgi:hypothetical protein
MSIEKLGQASGLIAALRAEMGRRTEKAAGKQASSRADSPQVESPPRDPKVLRQQLAELVRPVALDDADAVRAVRPKVFRAILLWEFGAGLRDHPDWQPMLESVTANLEENTNHQAQFLRLLAELKR